MGDDNDGGVDVVVLDASQIIGTTKKSSSSVSSSGFGGHLSLSIQMERV